MGGSALWLESGKVARGLAPFVRNHRLAFVKSALAAVLVVAARVALPWPLRAATDHWIQGSTGADAFVPAGLDPILAMGFAFVAVLFLFGLADHLLRLYAARFAIGVVRDLRRKTFKYLTGARASTRGPGDLVARLVGDTARIKSGIAGFLVHAVTSSLVILGVSTVLFLMNPPLGLILLSALFATLAITYMGASTLLEQSLKQRKKEGKIAEAIHEALSGEASARARKTTLQAINNKSSATEAGLTRVQGRVTWATFTVFGLAVFTAIAVGTGEVRSGHIGAADMVLFLLYALMMRAPMVMLARHGSRLGKTVAGSHRILEILDESKKAVKAKARKRKRRAKNKKRQRQAEKRQTELEVVAHRAQSQDYNERPASTPAAPPDREGVL